MHKLEWQSDGEWTPYSHPPIFTVENSSQGTPRLLAGVPNGGSTPFLKLLECLDSPFYLLHVLHTPRGEGSVGRYQSELLELEKVQALVGRFSSFLSGDARFDLWAHSPSSGGTIVWERHNLIYDYGPVERFSEALRSIGFTDGCPRIPGPHAHLYREEFDGDARALLAAVPWLHSELRPEDEQ